MVWSRPSGPPHIWRIAEIVNKNGEKKRFSFQEIPQDRYTEVLNHMCTIFLEDEAMCSSINLIDEKASVDAFREIWASILEQGISIAAYEEINNTKSVLAGLNILERVDNNTEKPCMDDMPTLAKKVCKFAIKFMDEGDARKLYKVDRYLSAFGLSVDPRYRGIGLGQKLLEIRDDVGKAYDIPVTGTLFTSITSQKVAARAGFDDYKAQAYDDVVDDNGVVSFPLLKGKLAKMMVKRLL